MNRINILTCVALTVFFTFQPSAEAQQTSRLQDELNQIPPAKLADEAKRFGDPERGALLFFKPELTCAKCHDENAYTQRLAPDLSKPQQDHANLAEHLVQSVLLPSKKIREGFETATVLDLDGNLFSGVLVEKMSDGITVADPSNEGQHRTFKFDDIEEWKQTEKSTMPDGLVNLLGGKSEFLDLAAYLIEVAEGGPKRALELRPPDSLYALPPIPEYEKRIDHAGLLASVNQSSFERGKEIYELRCINCHGTIDKEGSLPTSLRFAEGRFKNGSDPHSIYKTLTHGYGMMVRQSWLVPQQKYDVIHYIREHFLRDHNPSQYQTISDDYLASLPKGDTRGPKPKIERPWQSMNYGHVSINTIEVGKDATNFAYKGIAVRLDPGQGGVSQGNHWMLYDHDTMRVAAVWSASGSDRFIDYRGIHFDGRHNIHPRVVGTVQVENPNGPGWAEPGASDNFKDDKRITGRDDRIYGPLPRNWAQYKGRYDFADKSIVHYTVGQTDVMEMPGIQFVDNRPVFTRTIQIGPHENTLTLQVANSEGAHRIERTLGSKSIASFIGDQKAETIDSKQVFDGSRFAQVDGSDFDMAERDYTICARIKTTSGGTIFAKTQNSNDWVPNGKTLFIRGGRLCFDIGWVGVVTSRKRINDDKWHNVAMTWEAESGEVTLYIDGKKSGQGELEPEEEAENHVVRVGWTGDEFPDPSFFNGELDNIRFYQKRLAPEEIKTVFKSSSTDAVAHWEVNKIEDKNWPSSSSSHVAKLNSPGVKKVEALPILSNLVSHELPEHEWAFDDDNLRLQIPPSKQTITFTLFQCRHGHNEAIEEQLSPLVESKSANLNSMIRGGPKRWPQILETNINRGDDKGPLAVDILVRPEKNPWNCRLRMTGIDFLDDKNAAAVCTWDGSVFIVRGLLDEQGKLTWQRIASGLFQPLGVKVVDGDIYVGCRDQIVRLHDLNGDGEVDYYECFNNDHQVTDHFHEFAMGLQVDNDGNFYYAKSARHALKALVPHHGTLLKVSKDGTKTEIVANGFRAANGVCINPDGSFFVTDQEGHWTPKNRINRVVPGGFYGNMLGYHNVDDESDKGMDQPLVWITNEMDRSPGELLWVESGKWGPLNGALLNMSYGTGKIFLVPHEEVDDKWQGGVIELPIPMFPTGVMRGRFHPDDQHLYCCGMFAWSSNRQQPGGLYRLRATGKAMHLPLAINVSTSQLAIKFTEPIDAESVMDVDNWSIKTWDLKRSGKYGSDHLNEQWLEIDSASLSDDKSTVVLKINELKPTWCMEIRYSLKSLDGQRIRGTVHNTIHAVKNR